jgi:hypothetical protein
MPVQANFIRNFSIITRCSYHQELIHSFTEKAAYVNEFYYSKRTNRTTFIFGNQRAYQRLKTIRRTKGEMITEKRFFIKNIKKA